MTDSRLQQLKRAWEASGSVEDEAHLLLERVRIDPRELSRLQLGAYLEYPAALQALGLREQPVDDPEDRVLWLRGLSLWGKEALSRGLISWLLAETKDWERAQEVRRFMEAVEEWWSCPSPSTAQAIDDRTTAVFHTHDSRWSNVSVHSTIVTRALFEDPEGMHECYELLNQIHQIEIELAPPEPSVVCQRMWNWVSQAPPESLGAGYEVAEGNTLRQQVIDATTTPQRRRLVEEMRALDGEDVILITEDQERIKTNLANCDYESFLACSGPVCRYPLAGIVSVEPAQESTDRTA